MSSSGICHQHVSLRPTRVTQTDTCHSDRHVSPRPTHFDMRDQDLAQTAAPHDLGRHVVHGALESHVLLIVNQSGLQSTYVTRGAKV
eukprot:759052-Amorphochlora_amoeboformis.AAC.1